MLIFAAACDSAPRETTPSGTDSSSRANPATSTRAATATAQPTASTTAQTPPTTAQPVGPPADCKQWACLARQTLDLTGNYQITLWLAEDQRNYRSRPVIELLDQGVAVQWWISPQGDGWNGSLTCNTGGTEANCVLIASLGMHASVAEMLVLRNGRLVHLAGAEAVTNSIGMSAADLNDDGYLDVIGSANDYRPSYAQGHNYWQTFRYEHDRLVLTGCAPQPRGAPTPTRLLSGECPVI